MTDTEQQVTDPPMTDRVVLRDAFPATVTLDGDLFARTARVVVTRDRVYVYVTTAGPLLDAPYDPAASQVPRYNAPTGHRTILRLTSGANVVVDRQRGCGCSNPLRSWRPWKPYRVAA